MGNSHSFAAFVDDYFDAEFSWNPARATREGLHDYDRDMGDRSEEAHLARIDEIQTLLDRARKFGGSLLSVSDRIDLELILGQLEAGMLALATLGTWRRNPIDYLWHAGSALDALIKRRFAPPPRRLEALTSRLREFPRILDAMKSNVQNPPREFTEVALRLARGSVGFLGEGTEAWAREAAGGDPSLTAGFRSVHRASVTALEDAVRWLEDLLPRSTGCYAIGPDALARMLRHEEMTATSLDTLLATANTNLERDHRDFVAIASRIDSDRTPLEVMRGLSDDRPGETELLDWARVTIDRVCGFLDAHALVTLPGIPPPAIVETPPYYRFGAFAAMDSPGAYETVAREAFYYVTPPEADWDPAHKEEHLRLFNRPVMDLITIHETYPGHFLQFANAPKFPTHTRRLLSCGSNVEGWAHYAEQMMVEEGYGSGDLPIRAAQLQEALVRDCRFVAAIGLHTETLSVQDAARLFEDRAFMEPANALEEARRGTFDPTYLVYTLGKLQIYKLRDDWEAERGERDLRKFHDAFLREGGAPLRIIRRRMLRANSEDETLYPTSSYERATGKPSARG